MKKITHYVFLYLVLWSAASVAQEVPIPAPEVEIKGLAQSGRTSRALIAAGGHSRVIEVNQKLGDYLVTQISGDSVTFTYQDSLGSKPFPIKTDGFRVPAGTTLSGQTLSVAGVMDRLEAVDLLTRLMNRDFLADPEISGQTKVVASGVTIEEALSRVVGFSPSDKNGLLVVARGSREKAVQRANPLPGVSGTVTFEYRNADLPYVLKVMAREAGKKIEIDPRVAGSVTVKATNRTVAELMPQILAVQYLSFSVQVKDDTILVTKD